MGLREAISGGRSVARTRPDTLLNPDHHPRLCRVERATIGLGVDGAEGGPEKLNSLSRFYSAILKMLRFHHSFSFLTWPTELTDAPPLGTKWTASNLRNE